MTHGTLEPLVTVLGPLAAAHCVCTLGADIQGPVMLRPITQFSYLALNRVDVADEKCRDVTTHVRAPRAGIPRPSKPRSRPILGRYVHRFPGRYRSRHAAKISNAHSTFRWSRVPLRCSVMRRVTASGLNRPTRAAGAEARRSSSASRSGPRSH